MAVGFVGFLLTTKKTIWIPGTYLDDAESLALGIIGGAVIGFLLSCIVEESTNERQRRAKVIYWLFVMAVFGCGLGFGKGVSTRTTLIRMAWTLGIGLTIGFLQYFLQSKTKMPPI